MGMILVSLFSFLGNSSAYEIERNESDFDEEKHELFEAVKEVKKGSTAWYKQQLDELGVEYSDSDKKADLKAVYDSATED